MFVANTPEMENDGHSESYTTHQQLIQITFYKREAKHRRSRTRKADEKKKKYEEERHICCEEKSK
jgi:hypothetical protein